MFTFEEKIFLSDFKILDKKILIEQISNLKTQNQELEIFKKCLIEKLEQMNQNEIEASL